MSGMVEHSSDVREQKDIAIVLSGGGARGAYEVGVLKYIFTEFARRSGIFPRFRIFCGTSVGAIHVAFLASYIRGIQRNIRVLESIWRNIDGDSIFRTNFRSIIDMIMKPSSGRSLFDPTVLNTMITKGINWDLIRRNILDGMIKTVCVLATQLSTGRVVAFIDSSQILPEWKKDPFNTFVQVAIRPEHVLASAAIPIIFPPVKIDQRWYCDGGVRLNTPLTPAIRLGADKIFTVVLRYYNPAELPVQKEVSYPNLFYLIGKIMNALFIDRVAYDVARLEILNELISTVSEFVSLDKINERMREVRGYDMKKIQLLDIRPSVRVSEIAIDCARRYAKIPTSNYKIFIRMILELSQGTDTDILSYILFEENYARELMELGYKDAERQSERIYEFFIDED